MTLLDVVRELSDLDDDATIYASEPWTTDSEAIVALEPESGGTPPEAEYRGLAYFIEIDVAREFLKGFNVRRATPPSAEEQCRRLIRYAVTDA